MYWSPNRGIVQLHLLGTGKEILYLLLWHLDVRKHGFFSMWHAYFMRDYTLVPTPVLGLERIHLR